MTKKHYIAIANIIKEELEAGSNVNTIVVMTQKVAQFFKDDNPMFDLEQFRKACGLEEFRWVQNLMSRKWVLEHKDTPHCCSVGSETYWSM
jgi:hypothetical protein